jgi:RHS repeat-associated protein
MTEGTSGPGNNYLGTSVYLRRATARGRGYEVLGYPEDTSTWARGKAVLALHWRDNSALEIMFQRKPKLDLQVCKYGDIEISVKDGPWFIYNLRFPGQYYDAETGLNYNYQRDLDTTTGRYVESDPIGLRGGGYSTYLYGAANPVSFSDPNGLQVTGSWLATPQLNVTDYGIIWPQTHLVAPHFTKFGYLKFVSFTAFLNGYINIDVHCSDNCHSWDIHNKLDVGVSSSFDIGPNLYAIAASLLSRNATIGLATNVAALTATLGSDGIQLANLLNRKVNPIVNGILQYGPTAICLAYPKPW